MKKKSKSKPYPLHGFARTDGNQLWNGEKRDVKITGLTVSHISEDLEYMCFEIFFSLKTWNISKHGLIYTDRQWIKEVRKLLRDNLHISVDCAKSIDYTEQGMQGDNYVSLCVGKRSTLELVKRFLDLGIISFNIKNYK